MTVPVQNGRASIDDLGHELRVVIPARRRPVILIFLLVWLGGWFFGLKSALTDFLPNKGVDRGFMTFWLIAWILGGISVIGIVLWTLAGREVMRLTQDLLIIRREVFGIGWTRRYDLRHVALLRTRVPARSPVTFDGALAFWGLAGGPIVFDYGAKTLHIGAGIDEAEGRQVVARLVKHDRRLVSAGTA